MKRTITIISSLLILALAVFAGLKYYMVSRRPDLNGNEKILSEKIDGRGIPQDKFGDVTETSVTRDKSQVYLSVPVNNKKIKKSRVTLEFHDEIQDDREIEVSEGGYVTYPLENLESMEAGFYQFTFYNSQGEIEVYAGVNLE